MSASLPDQSPRAIMLLGRAERGCLRTMPLAGARQELLDAWRCTLYIHLSVTQTEGIARNFETAP